VTGLGLGSKPEPTELAAGFRGGFLKYFRFGLSSAGGAAIVFGIFELLQQQPQEGFKLLAQWGPWPVIALVAIVIVALPLGSFLSKMNDTVSTTFGAVVMSVQQQAEASGKTAEALTRLADQGGQQAEEVRRLAIYAARGLDGMNDRFDKLDSANKELAEGLKGVLWAVNVKAANSGQGGEVQS
jgi:hypothetical protein